MRAVRRVAPARTAIAPQTTATVPSASSGKASSGRNVVWAFMRSAPLEIAFEIVATADALAVHEDLRGRSTPCSALSASTSSHDRKMRRLFRKRLPQASAWLADIIYIATGEGWLYLAAVLDLATRKIIVGPCAIIGGPSCRSRQ